MLQPQIYSFSSARANFSRLIETRRAQLPATLRTRQCRRPDGSTFTQHYQVGASLLSDGAEKTGWALIRLALDALEQVLRVPLLAAPYEQALAAGEWPAVPAIATNTERLCQAIARGKRVAARTVRNHLAELRAAGFIPRQQYRGWQHDFYLWISPELVWRMAKTPVENPASPLFYDDVTTVFQEACGTNFPPYELQATMFKEEIETGDGDKLVSPEARSNRAMTTGHTTGHTGAQDQAEPHPAKPEISHRGGAAPVLTSGPSALAAPGTGQKKHLPEWQQEMVRDFWAIAWRDLYHPRGQNFTPDEQRKALNAIYLGVYNGFGEHWEQLPPHAQKRYHDVALERLGLAAAYFRRNLHKYPPLPWAEYLPGAGYFDAENARGFVKTWEWHEQQRVHRMQRATAEGLRKARRVFTQHCLGKAPQRYQQKSTLDLYRFFETQFKKLGQPALHRFRLYFDTPPVAARA